MPSPVPPTTPDARRDDAARGRRLHALTQIVAVGFVALLLVVAATATGRWELDPRWQLEAPSTTDVPPPPTATGMPSNTPSEDPPLDLDEVPSPDLTWLAVTIGVIAAALLLLVLLRVLAYLRRPRAEELPDPGTSADYGEDEQLRAVGPPRDAIVSAWLALEEAADRSGARRRPSQTPTEHAAAVLERTGADREATEELLHLYHRARFSSREPGSADLAAAGRALQTLADSWPELAHGSVPSQAEPGSGANR